MAGLRMLRIPKLVAAAQKHLPRLLKQLESAPSLLASLGKA